MKALSKLFKMITSRLFLVGLMLILQIALIVALVWNFSNSSVYIYIGFHLLSILCVLYIISKDQTPEFKITWIVFVLALPLLGGVFYFLFGNNRMPNKIAQSITNSEINLKELLPSKQLVPKNKYNQLSAKFLEDYCGYPVMNHTSFEYYSVGEKMYVRMMEEMEKAEKYIFAEFFIVHDGQMLDEITDLFERKIKQGVEVFFMYDDLGTIFNMSKKAEKRIRDVGVKTVRFNPFRPHLSAIANYRDHRKIVVIDGKFAFTGGINIADEYINKKQRFGHWKDTGIFLQGEAAWALGVMFVQHWNFAGGPTISYASYAPEVPFQVKSDGLVQVCGDGPADHHNFTETIYIKAIQQATDYIYISTPYLVIDYAMQESLCMAAMSGVDVRIITPHIYDKWYVHTLTTSHYTHLIESGVKIYEYKPGFLHGKMFVADDRLGVVGTCNMDFRSFYLHFESSVLLYEGEIISTIKQDLVETFAISLKITKEALAKIPFRVKVLQYLLKLFAPLM